MHVNQASSSPGLQATTLSGSITSQRCGDLSKKSGSGSKKDDRITIKIDKEMWKVITKQMSIHPEWGVKSVSDFIRRAVARELEAKSNVTERKVLEIELRPRFSPEDSRGRDPGRPPG